jgi:hypothetical protein
MECVICEKRLEGKQKKFCSRNCKQKAYYQRNAEYKKEYQRTYKEKNKEVILQKNRDYYHKNAKKYYELKKAYRKNNRDKVLENARRRRRERYKTDPHFKINRNISSGIYFSLKSEGILKGGRRWVDLVGYNLQQFMDHIEKQFIEGMSWKNHGEWHIEHIIPISFFQFKSTDDVEFRMCWRLENIRPLWAKDNNEKKDKVKLWGKVINAKKIDKEYFAKLGRREYRPRFLPKHIKKVEELIKIGELY